jgi:hypothetical protein
VTYPHGLLPGNVGCHPRTTCHYFDKCHAQIHLRVAFSKSTQPDMERRSGVSPQIDPAYPPGEKTCLRSTQPNTAKEKTHLRSTQLSPSGRRHMSTQLTALGRRPEECLRKLQSSTLPLNESDIHCHAKFITKVHKLRPGKGLGENMCDLLIGRKVLHLNCLPLHHITNIVILDLNMFGTVMTYWIL